MGLQELIQQNLSFAPKQSLEEIFAILQRRASMLKQFENAVLKEKSNGARYSFFLSCALTYLRSSGFLIFRGITHKQHPDVLKPKSKHASMSLNYDNFWEKLGFDKSPTDDTHPWVTSTNLVNDIIAGSHAIKLRPAGKTVLDYIRDAVASSPTEFHLPI